MWTEEIRIIWRREKYINRSSMIGTLHHVLFEEDEVGGTCGMYGERETHMWFWSVSLNEGDFLDDIGLDGKMTLN